MDSNIACCYLTHNHPDVVRDVLQHIGDFYEKNGIDIYFYDSSNDTKTREIVEAFMGGKTGHVFYIPVDDELGGDGKLLEILKGYGLQKEYDYIWPCKDRIYVTEDTLDAIRREAGRGYDCIYLDFIAPSLFERRDYKDLYDREEFFYEFGAFVTDWEVVLISTDKILNQIFWTEFEEEYGLGRDNNFNQVMVVFGGLSDSGLIRVLHGEEAQNAVSSYGGIGSQTLPDFVEIWGRIWVEDIERLPDCYSPYKKKVIKDAGNMQWIFGSLNRVIQLVQSEQLTRDIFESIRKNWESLTDVDATLVDAVLDGHYQEAILLSFTEFNQALLREDYNTALKMCLSNSIYGSLIGEKSYEAMRFVMLVYQAEVNSGQSNGVLSGVRTPEDLLERYQYLKDIGTC